MSWAQMKQCASPVSNRTETLRCPDGIQMKPVTTGLKVGSRRYHGVKVAWCTSRARAKSSSVSYTASVAITELMVAVSACMNWPDAAWWAKPRG